MKFFYQRMFYGKGAGKHNRLLGSMIVKENGKSMGFLKGRVPFSNSLKFIELPTIYISEEEYQDQLKDEISSFKDKLMEHFSFLAEFDPDYSKLENENEELKYELNHIKRKMKEVLS